MKRLVCVGFVMMLIITCGCVTQRDLRRLEIKLDKLDRQVRTIAAKHEELKVSLDRQTSTLAQRVTQLNTEVERLDREKFSISDIGQLRIYLVGRRKGSNRLE